MAMWKQVVQRSLPHFALLLICTIYVLLGAAIFQAVEQKDHISRLSTLQREIKVQRDTAAGQIYDLCDYKDERQVSKHEFLEIVREKISEIVTGKELQEYEEKKDVSWSYGSAVFYCFSIVTTIGHTATRNFSTEGRVMTLFYGLLGIPLTLVTIANLGKFFAAAMFLLLQKMSFIRRRTQGSDIYNCSNIVSFSIVCILMTFYLFAGAACYSYWEEIQFFDSLHFVVMSLFTVGSDENSPKTHAYLFVIILYLILGLVMLWLILEMVATAIRKVHYIGIPPKDLSSCPIYLGDKILTVHQLAAAVASAAGLKPADSMMVLNNLNDVISETIAAPDTPVQPLISLDPEPFGLLYNIAQDSIPFFDDRDSVKTFAL